MAISLRLIDYSGSTGDLQTAAINASDLHNDNSEDTDRAQSHDFETQSPFVLKAPSPELLQSSIRAVSPVHHGQERMERDIPENHVLGAGVDNIRIKSRGRGSKTSKRSRYGIPCASMPSGITKNIVLSFLDTTARRKSKVSEQILQTIIEVGDLYFERISQDLAAFSAHAGRKKIDESDVIAIMKR